MDPGPALGAARLLVVDDDESVLAAVTALAQRALAGPLAPRVSVASSAAEAMDVLTAWTRETEPVVVLADFNLGVGAVNGLELLRDVARARPDARRVLMSGYDLETFAPQLREAGLDGVLEKPIRMDALARMLGPLARAPPSP